MQPLPIVRDANRTVDGDAVAAVYRRSWRAAFGHVLGQAQVSDAALTERGMALLASPLCLVAVLDDRVAGMAAGDPATGHLDVLYVDPLWWGRGAGAALANVAVDRLRGSECEPWLWVWEQNSAAHALYGRLGWVDSGARRTAEVGAVWFEYQRWVHRGAVPTRLG